MSMISVFRAWIVIFTILETLASLVNSEIVDGGAYRIENVRSGLQMTTQSHLSGQDRLAYVITDEWVNSKEQKWGVEFFSKDKTLSPGSVRENNVTLQTNPGSSFLTSILYDIPLTQEGADSYYIKNKIKAMCLNEQDRVIHLGPCEGEASQWKFYRTG